MESSNSNSKERELQLTQRLAKQRHSICMTWFEQLETTSSITQFKEFLASKGVNATDLLNQGWQQDFEDFTRCEPSAYRRDLLETFDTLEAVIHKAVITYGRLQLHWIELENHNALSKSVNETQLQQHESLVTESTTLEANLNSDVKALDAGPVNDQLPSAEVHLTAPHNVLATEQYQAKSPLLKAELVKSKEMIEKETYNELSRRFLLLEKHCISLEISMQQKEENFQSNKPCKNQDAPEFCEFFEINDLKAQLRPKPLNCNLKNQIKSVKEASNEAKVKHEIDVLETINIELESSVAKLLAENEKLNKENEHLKQTYKELYDSIKKTRISGLKDHKDSLDWSVNRNHLVVRQPNAFTSERPRISRPRFASQVDEKNDLSKTVTPHYLPKVRESAAAKPHQVNAPNYSRNSHKESYGSNDMVHAYFLEDARKMTQDKTRIPSHKDMASTRAHCTPNACTPKPRNIYRSSPVSKCSGGMSNAFWNTMTHDAKTGAYSFSKLDGKMFTLSADLFERPLEITLA
ncbi:hypothetical protein Tco_0599965 [Tanacetum coccineum]